MARNSKGRVFSLLDSIGKIDFNRTPQITRFILLIYFYRRYFKGIV